jgi:hypothetical protein
VADQLRSKTAARILANVGPLDRQPGKLATALLEVGHDVVRHVLREGDRLERVGALLVAEALLELGQRDAEDCAEASEHSRSSVSRQTRGPDAHDHGELVADDLPTAIVEDRSARRLDPDRS